MQVKLIYRSDSRLQSITFANYREEMGRMARIDLDIVKAVGWCGTSAEKDGVRVFDRELGGDNTIGFSKIEEEKIKKLLAGYCIEPEIVNNDQCAECGGNGRCCDACCDERGIG